MLLSTLPIGVHDIIYDYVNDIPFTMSIVIDTQNFWSEHTKYKIILKCGYVVHHTECFMNEPIYISNFESRKIVNIYTNEVQIIKFDFINDRMIVGEDRTLICVSDKQMKRMFDICTKTLHDSSFNVVKVTD